MTHITYSTQYTSHCISQHLLLINRNSHLSKLLLFISIVQLFFSCIIIYHFNSLCVSITDVGVHVNCHYSGQSYRHPVSTQTSPHQNEACCVCCNSRLGSLYLPQCYPSYRHSLLWGLLFWKDRYGELSSRDLLCGWIFHYYFVLVMVYN